MNADTARMFCVVAAIAAENPYITTANYLPIAAHFLAHCGQPCADMWDSLEGYISLPYESCPLFHTVNDVAAYIKDILERATLYHTEREYLMDAHAVLMANAAATADTMPEKELSDVAACLMYAAIYDAPAAYVNAAMQRVYGR